MQRTKPAAVWKRILAFLFDLYLVVMLTGIVLVRTTDAPSSLAAALSMAPSGPLLAAAIYLSLFLLIYHAFSEYLIGQSAGMLLFGITASAVPPTRPLRLWQATVRNLYLIPLFPLTLLWLIEPLHYIFTGERLLERWTHTTTLEAA